MRSKDPHAGTYMRAWSAVILLLVCGCASEPAPIPTTQPGTAVAAPEATPKYWLDKPAVAAVSAGDFTRLWEACADTVRNYQFPLDREDYRDGVLTSLPVISRQVFEPWRRDAGTHHAVWQSTLDTIRRTIRFDVARDEDGQFVARPRVLVERLSQLQRRITSASEYTLVFTAPGANLTTDQGVILPARYWYAIGRDEAMEKDLADSVRDKVKSR
jgi:hypothetical protein